jgi:hypothetical protein
VRRKADLEPGVIYGFQVSPDLVNWTNVAAPIATVVVDPVWERVRFESAHTSGALPQLKFWTSDRAFAAKLNIGVVEDSVPRTSAILSAGSDRLPWLPSV